MLLFLEPGSIRVAAATFALDRLNLYPGEPRRKTSHSNTCGGGGGLGGVRSLSSACQFAVRCGKEGRRPQRKQPLFPFPY